MSRVGEERLDEVSDMMLLPRCCAAVVVKSVTMQGRTEVPHRSRRFSQSSNVPSLINITRPNEQGGLNREARTEVRRDVWKLR